MRRKIIQIADSTQLISLPRKWCLERGIKKGEELNVEEIGDKLVISTEKGPIRENIEVNVSGLDMSSIMFLIRGLYKKGYDEIAIRYNKPTARYCRLQKDVSVSPHIHKEVSRCPGLEIIEQRDGYVLLKVISSADPKEFDNILRRTFIIINDLCQDLVTASKNNDRLLIQSLEEKDENATKFINHSLRLINKKYNTTKNSHFMYQVIVLLEKIVDIIRNTGRMILEYDKKVRPESFNVLKLIHESFQIAYTLYFRWKLEDFCKLSEQKEIIQRAVLAAVKVIPKEETVILEKMNIIPELHRSLAEARASIEF